jgi:predicted glutamine amidotransferase
MGAGETPMQATFWLLEAPDSLEAQSRHNPDGTGVGWFDGGRVAHVDKQPIAAFEDRRFASDARHITSKTFVAHVRHASTGAHTMANTHPFCIDEMLFAHNGVIQGLDELERELGPALEKVGGETDSERLFALIWKETQRRGATIADAIGAAARWVADELPIYAINLVLATADHVWALRYPETHSLFVLERVAGGGEPGPDEALEQSSSTGTRIHAERGRTHPLVVIASERMDDDPHWRELRSGELIRVDASLKVQSTQLFDGPPAHLLKLADLDEAARASQA